jgi:hypothetical protein
LNSHSDVDSLESGLLAMDCSCELSCQSPCSRRSSMSMLHHQQGSCDSTDFHHQGKDYHDQFDRICSYLFYMHYESILLNFPNSCKIYGLLAMPCRPFLGNRHVDSSRVEIIYSIHPGLYPL